MTGNCCARCCANRIKTATAKWWMRCELKRWKGKCYNFARHGRNCQQNLDTAHTWRDAVIKRGGLEQRLINSPGFYGRRRQLNLNTENMEGRTRETGLIMAQIKGDKAVIKRWTSKSAAQIINRFMRYPEQRCEEGKDRDQRMGLRHRKLEGG